MLHVRTYVVIKLITKNADAYVIKLITALEHEGKAGAAIYILQRITLGRQFLIKKEWRQVYQTGSVENYRKQARTLVYIHITMCACGITVVYELWMQRHTHITLCNLVTI